MFTKILTALLLVLTSTLCYPKEGIVYQQGTASHYGGRFHGRLTASGEIFNQNNMTAAHKTLPFGTILRVVNLKTSRSIIVRVTDRGPYVKGRIIDLSTAAAQLLQVNGLAHVALYVQKLGKGGYSISSKQQINIADVPPDAYQLTAPVVISDEPNTEY